MSESIKRSNTMRKKENFFQRQVSKFKKSPLWQKILKIFLLMMMILTICGGIFAAVLVHRYSKELVQITPENFYTAKNSTNVYDRDGQYIGSLSLNNIKWIDYKDEAGNQQISQYYIDGLIATEDENFYSHHGIDYWGMAKGAISTIFLDSNRGGSTLTMQLAKIVYMQDWVTYNEEGIDRRSQDKIGYKITQMLYAREIEKNFTKEEILENYMNVVGFGDAGSGIVNGSMYYYNKAPADLTLTEAATLAGMSQLPAEYNPYRNPEGTKLRRDAVLGRMLAEKKITQEEYDQAVAEPIDATLVPEGSQASSNSLKYQGYLDVVYQEFLELVDPDNNGAFDINLAGMDIYVNMDATLQEGVYDIINNSNYFTDEFIQTGVVLMDSKNGEVLAIGNGRNGHGGFFGTNYAYNFLRQPGSTAKPIVDAAPAIEYLDWSTAHPVNDEETSYDGGPSINNADGKYLGWLTLTESLGKSRNTTAVNTFKQVSSQVGVNQIYDFVVNLGFSQIERSDFNQAYAIGGWQKGTTPYQLAGAYAAFGNGGTYYEPHTIDHIDVSPESQYYDDFGEVIEPDVNEHRAMKESTAFMIGEMLLSTRSEATGYAPVASAFKSLSVKTGTSDWGEYGQQYGIPEASQRDKWVVGFNNAITLVTWTGYPTEYEKQGYYIHDDDENYRACYQALANFVANYGPQDVLTDLRISQPSNVVSKNASVVDGKIVDGGAVNYFIEGSADLTGISSEVKQVSGVNVSVNQDTQMVDITWQANETAPDRYIVLVDGKEVASTSDTKVSVPFSKLAESAGCKTSYQISLLAQKDGKNSTPSSSFDVTFKDDSFCKTPTEPEEEEDTSSQTQQVRINKFIINKKSYQLTDSFF